MGKKSPIVIILVLFLIVLLVVAVVSVLPEDVFSPDSDRYDLICDIEINNLPTQPLNIVGNPVCYHEKSRLFSLYSIFYDEGNLYMKVQNKEARVSVKVWEWTPLAQSKTFSLKLNKLDPGSTEVRILLYNELGNQLLDSKTFNYNIGG